MLDNKCEELLQELLNEKRKVRNLEAELEEACQENNELTEYLDFLEGTMICSYSVNLKHTGWPINEVGKRQRSRKVKVLKSRSERALLFLELFGLTLDWIKVKDLNGNMTEMDCITSDNSNKAFHQLLDQDKDTIRALLYIMDKCCVGDAAYHEMSMIVDGLSRSYLIKQCRSSLNSIVHITRTPGKKENLNRAPFVWQKGESKQSTFS